MKLIADSTVLILAVYAIAGAVVAAVLGYLESGEAFEFNKFLASLLRGVVSAIAAIFVFQDVAVITIWDGLQAFLLGAGIDVLGHRLSGVVNRVRSP